MDIFSIIQRLYTYVIMLQYHSIIQIYSFNCLIFFFFFYQNKIKKK
jgi:hypothetical protein